MATVVRDVPVAYDATSVVRQPANLADEASLVGRPRVLLLSTWHPMPADNGRKQRTLGLIEALKDDYDILLVSLLPESTCRDESLADVPGVASQTVLPLPAFDSHSRPTLSQSLSRWPRSVSATWCTGTADAIVALARSSGATVAVGTDLRTLPYLRHLRQSVGDIRTILDEPDVSPYVGVDRDAARAEQIRARLRRRKYERYLNDAAPDLDAVVVASRNEMDAYRELSCGQVASIVENGVHEFPAPWSPSGSTGLLYTGSLSYGPNLEAVSWYARSILPLLRTQLSSPVLHVTGVLPEFIPDILKQPAFRLTGRLDDLDAIYRASDVFVAPILSGTGTRIKILEAMAIGMPVVTTSKGCEGIPLVPGEHALVADTPQEFTLAVLRVLRDPEFAQSLGRRGRLFVKRHANWSTSAEQFRRIVADLLESDR